MANTNTDRGYNFNIESQHISHNTRVVGKDLWILRKQVWEAMCSVGITTYFYRCNSEQPDFYQDPNCTWEDGVLLDCIFEDNPKIKTLKNVGWFSEDEEIRPQLIYLPIYKDWTTKEILDVTINSLVKINYFGQTEPAEFRITDKKLDSVYGCYYICKLAPERMECFEEVQENGFRYLRKREENKEIIQPCEHEIQSNIISEENGGKYPDDREFHHDDYDDYSTQEKIDADNENRKIQVIDENNVDIIDDESIAPNGDKVYTPNNSYNVDDASDDYMSLLLKKKN